MGGNGRRVISTSPAVRARFVRAFWPVLFDAELSDSTKMTYLSLQRYAEMSENGIAFPGEERLAAERHVSSRAIRRHLQELIKPRAADGRPWLIISRTGRHNRYELTEFPGETPMGDDRTETSAIPEPIGQKLPLRADETASESERVNVESPPLPKGVAAEWSVERRSELAKRMVEVFEASRDRRVTITGRDFAMANKIGVPVVLNQKLGVAEYQRCVQDHERARINGRPMYSQQFYGFMHRLDGILVRLREIGGDDPRGEKNWGFDGFRKDG